MSAPVLRQLWRPVAIALAIAFVYYRVFAKLGYDWWTDENYSHGLLIPLVIAYIIWTERSRLAAVQWRPATLWGILIILLALLSLWVGAAGAELYVQRISLVLMLVGVVLYFWGAPLLRRLFVPFALLLLALPVPAIIFNKVAFPLQLFASRCAVWFMRLFEIPVLRQGNVIELMPKGAHQTKKLEVVEACSGIRSLMTLLTLAVVFAYVTRPRRNDSEMQGGLWQRVRTYDFWRAIILVASAIPIAILTNALRVSGTGILAHYYGADVADGFFHTFSGWVMYIVAFLLLFAVGWLLDLLAKRGKGDRGGGQATATVEEAKAVKVEPAAPASGKTPVTVIPAKGVE